MNWMKVTIEPKKAGAENEKQKPSAKTKKCDAFPWTKLLRSGQNVTNEYKRLIIRPYVLTDPKRPLRKGFTLGNYLMGKRKSESRKIRLLRCQKRTVRMHLLPAFSKDIRTVTMITALCVTLPVGYAITKTDLTVESGVRGDHEPTAVPCVRHQVARPPLCPWPRTPRTMAERRLQNLSIDSH